MTRRGVFPFRAAKPLVGDDGASLLEFAITFPIYCLMIFSLMELCLLFYSYDLISECAREGTRYAMVHGASCPTTSNPTCEATASQVNSYVSAIGLPNLAGGTITPDTTYPDGDEAVGSRVQVKVTYTFRITMPLVPKKSISLTSTSVRYIVQ